MKGQGEVGVFLLLLVFMCALVALFFQLSGTAIVTDSEGVKMGRPKDFAEATGIARSADLAMQATATAIPLDSTRVVAEISAQATSLASNSQGTATASAVQAESTRVSAAMQVSGTVAAIAQQIEATATAKPYQASVAAATANTQASNLYAVTAIFWGSGLVLVLVGFGVAALVRTRAHFVPRDASGQLPAFWDGKTLTDPARQLGPSVTMTNSPDALWKLARIVRYIRTGDVTPLPETRVQLTDGNADADHLLEAARVAGVVGVAAATFRPDNAERGRRAKIEMLHKSGSDRPLGIGVGSPITRVIVTGDSAIAEIAKQLGDRIPLQVGSPADQSPQIIEGET
jgi:hypothetical protein